ncbi:MAG: hypothetical protein J6M18_06035 [Actinomycetaceae bacterium]|nr:hypothetical protein [Actinomycetaceae bacterium]
MLNHPNGGTSEFADTLRNAITKSGMSLTQIVDKLSERNTHVTQAALSYWQSGRSLPRRQRSRQALTELEHVLSISEGSLTVPLHNELIALNTGSSTVTSAPHNNISPNTQPNQHDIDWSNEVYREMLSIRATLSPDKHVLTEKVTALVRIPDVRNATYHAGQHWTPPSQKPILIDIEGATRNDDVVTEEQTFITRLTLPHTCKPGDLHQLSYTTITKSTQPFDRITERWFAWPMRYVTIFVDFGGHVPQNIQWRQEKQSQQFSMNEKVVSSKPLIPLNGTVQASALNVNGGSGVICWKN